ncbi:UNVERIFIED_CONTAM: hypothetical protein HDU68_002552 [Siphonaria sp. JEL0065]|nr:hypothetical protein HDU68_002552 [Siphonaria sp. JEL0065]
MEYVKPVIPRRTSGQPWHQPLMPFSEKIKKFSHDEDDNDNEQVEESKTDNQDQETTATSAEKAPKKKRKNKGAAKKAAKKAERLALAQKEKEERLANGGPEKLPTPRDLAREYLTLWSNDRKTWKFKKARQLHLLDTWNVADDVFPIAVKYCKDIPEGNSRKVTLNQMKEIIVKGVTPKEDVEEEPEKEDEKEAQPEGEPKKMNLKASKKNQITQEMFQRAWKLIEVLEKKVKK